MRRACSLGTDANVLADWAKEGVHTRGVKQVVWEVLSSRTVSVDDWRETVATSVPARIYPWTRRARKAFERRGDSSSALSEYTTATVKTSCDLQ